MVTKWQILNEREKGHKKWQDALLDKTYPTLETMESTDKKNYEVNDDGVM